MSDRKIKEFPIMVGDRLSLQERRGERVVIVKSIPWEMIDVEPCREWADRNHGQSLAVLASRCGLSPCEAICIIACMPWQKIGSSDEDAHRILYAMRALYNRGKLSLAP